VAGIWLGAFVSDDSGETMMNVHALVSPEDNRAFFINMMPLTNQIYAQGTMSLQGDEVAASLNTCDEDGAPAGELDLTAELEYAGDGVMVVWLITGA